MNNLLKIIESLPQAGGHLFIGFVLMFLWVCWGIGVWLILTTMRLMILDAKLDNAERGENKRKENQSPCEACQSQSLPLQSKAATFRNLTESGQEFPHVEKDNAVVLRMRAGILRQGGNFLKNPVNFFTKFFVSFHPLKRAEKPATKQVKTDIHNL